ncbi:MAG: hypothetical protein JXA74_04885 [Anaerolineae bacterium]|nr:hypothetical protein [Anaerolineae bacterium]
MCATYAMPAKTSGCGLCDPGWSAAADLAEYDGLRRRAALAQWIGRLTRRQHGLRSLSEALQGYRLCGQREVGLRAVPLERIVGSEGRCRDFDRHFRPLRAHTQDRWLRIARARRQGITLPPVDLIQVGDEYYVRDGNHRISVAWASGQTLIDAMVTEYHVVPRPTVELRTPALRFSGGGAALAAAA